MGSRVEGGVTQPKVIHGDRKWSDGSGPPLCLLDLPLLALDLSPSLALPIAVLDYSSLAYTSVAALSANSALL